MSMGYIAHHALVITDYDGNGTLAPWQVIVEDFRREYDLERYIVGPIGPFTNGYVSYIYAPDGSKEGWDTSDEHDANRRALIDLLSNPNADWKSRPDFALVRFGGDESELATIEMHDEMCGWDNDDESGAG